MSREQTAHLLLRIGAAFAFAYPPLRAIADPISWLGYVPPFVRAIPVDSIILLHGFGVLEAILALWILSGRAIRTPAALATVILLAIVVFNRADMDVLFRDLSIAMMTLALVFWPRMRTPLPINALLAQQP